jgi:hypothetical protein
MVLKVRDENLWGFVTTSTFDNVSRLTTKKHQRERERERERERGQTNQRNR